MRVDFQNYNLVNQLYDNGWKISDTNQTLEGEKDQGFLPLKLGSTMEEGEKEM